MSGRRAGYVLLGSVALVVALWVAYHGLPLEAERPPVTGTSSALERDSEPRGLGGALDGGENREAPAGRPSEVSSKAPGEAVPAELLSLLRACMGEPELRPSPRSAPDLRVDGRLLEDCLRGADALDVLEQLSAALVSPLVSLEEADREDAALLMGYVARGLLRSASTTTEKLAVISPVLDGYRTIAGPYLQEMTSRLLVSGFVPRDDPSGVAKGVETALARELEVGAEAHTLGPLLSSVADVSYSASRSVNEVPVPREALDSLEQTVERAVPKAIEIGLAGVRPGGRPHELRDALVLLERAFNAGSDDSKSLREALPRVLDALAELNVNEIRESGVRRRTLNGLLVQAELRMIQGGAAEWDQVPTGGETSPAGLRRQWGIEDRLPGQGNAGL